MNECLELKKNFGLSRCMQIPQMPRSMITTPANFKFTAADLASEDSFKTALENAIVAGYADRIYLWPFFSAFENASEAAVYEENAYGSMAVRGGRYRFRFSITTDLCTHTAMFSHKASSGRAFIYDSEDNLLGTKDTDGNFYGFTLNLLNPENLVISDGAVSTKSPVYVVLANPNELNKNGAMVKASFINTIDRLTDVEPTVVLPSIATRITVNILNVCDGGGLEGLIAGDFVVKKTDGSPQTITTVTPLGNGVYQLNGTLLTSGTVDLKSAAALSVKNYESTGPATVTIP